jgi:CTP synthase
VAQGQTKYIFVTGGVLSGLGKGITAASIGNLLRARGLTVNLQKCDPYLNVDAGLLNPREHGECFVTKDGAETDLDLGHYERFTGEEMTKDSSLMAGRVMLKVIQDERAGKYNGDDVQIIPHLTAAIQDYIQAAGHGYEVHIVEIGGTVGDYESLSFIEAIREFSIRVGRENCLYVHVVYLPYLTASQEIKTKPAQNSVRELRGLGVTPDILVGRSEVPANGAAKRKLSLFSGVGEESIVLLPNANTIYEVPLTIEDSGIAQVIVNKLNVAVGKKPKLNDWRLMVDRATKDYGHKIKVGVVAKYLDNSDTYMSVFEALHSAAWWNDTGIDLIWIDAIKLAKEKNPENILDKCDAIVVPGGFGSRGVEGKIIAAKYALKGNLPYLGLCYGLHMAVIAAAQLGGLKQANTTEVDPRTIDPVIDTMDDQRGKENTGGTMRLGNYNCNLQKGSLVANLYATEKIIERHRHRYECNPKYVSSYLSWGIKAVGINPETGLVEVIEGINNKFFVACQFHPEFKSRPTKPHPLFDGLIKAALQNVAK